jgi:zinc D-Ala-D-Ala dipeptidase
MRHHRRLLPIDLRVRGHIAFAILVISAPLANAGPAVLPADDFAWVNVRDIAPTIRIELRYATSKNIAHTPIYPCGMQPMIRAGVARRLIASEATLRRYNCRLKLWDAYRPPLAQARLWKLAPVVDYVADPQNGSGSLHSWGVAVDATIVDDWGQPLSMPTDFDDFTPASMFRYIGANPSVRWHLYLLQRAMMNAGFDGQRMEWWHFSANDWKRYVPEKLARPGNAAVLAVNE